VVVSSLVGSLPDPHVPPTGGGKVPLSVVVFLVWLLPSLLHDT
jgi:hypothetical protein